MCRVYNELPLSPGRNPPRVDIAVLSNDKQEIEIYIEDQKAKFTGRENKYGPLYSLPIFLGIEVKRLALDPRLTNTLWQQLDNDLSKYDLEKTNKKLNLPEYILLVGVDQRVRDGIEGNRYMLEVHERLEDNTYVRCPEFSNRLGSINTNKFSA